MYQQQLIVIIFLLSLVITRAVILQNDTCSNLQIQRSLDLEQIEGSWYVVEVVYHTNVSRTRDAQRLSPRGNLACAVLHLELLNTTTVLLEWEQQPPYPTLEYSLAVPDISSPGRWVAFASPWFWPHGTAPEQIQITKAVGDHAAVTFCQPGSGGHVFTAVLGRRNKLAAAQLRSVNAMLTRRGLSEVSTQVMDHTKCQGHRAWNKGVTNDTSKRFTNFPFIIFVTFFVINFKKFY